MLCLISFLFSPSSLQTNSSNSTTTFFMAVEASCMNLLPSHLLTNREIIKSNIQHHQQQHHHHQQQQQQHQNLLNLDIYNNNNAQVDSASALPLPATMAESLLPFYQSNVCDPNTADSGLTYNLPLQRKRSREFTSELASLPAQQKNKLSSESSFFDQFVYQFQNQQSEIDRVIAHHTEKVRMEMEEHKMRQSRMLACAIQETVGKKLKEKDEEVQKMGKLNWMLQERVKSLSVENQFWKDLAQTNETTANYLRNNLEQVMAHVREGRHAAPVPVAEDAGSCCGSNDAAEDGEDTAATPGVAPAVRRMCRSCGVRESVVLLLPCRHLCLCTGCGSAIRNCPVCDSGMDASVHVNLS